MNLNTQISNAISSGQDTAIAWANGYISRESLGDQLGCLELKLVVLTEWISMLTAYLAESFDENGFLIEDAITCLTQAEAMLLVGKITALAAC
jgi:hypothetical protein